MKTLIKVCIVIGFFFTTADANAQLWKRVKNKVKEKVEKKVEEKIEKKTDEVLDSLLSKPKDDKNTKKNPMGDLDTNGMMDILNSSKNAKYDQEYTFPITATMVITNGSSEPQQMTQSYGKKAMLSKVENTPGVILTDFVNETLIMLNAEEKSAQVISMKMMNMFGKGNNEAESDETTVPKILKTGKTKTMNGYLCYEYNITAEDVKINAWFAPEVNFNYQDYLSGFTKMFAGKKSANPMSLLSNGNGYMMEMTAIDAEGESTTMKITNISEVSKTINMSSYKIQKL